MLLSTLIGATVRCKSNPDITGVCVDFFIDKGRGAPIFMLAQLDGNSGREMALIRTATITVTDDGIQVTDIADATEELDFEMAEKPRDLSGLPPVVVGPFGHTYAPAMLGALLNDIKSSYGTVSRPDLAQTDHQGHWLSHLAGLPVFDTTQELGILTDIETKGKTLRFDRLVVQEDERTVGYPYSQLRDVAHDESSLLIERQNPPLWSAEAIKQQHSQ